jgi:predicted GIY-YIG superfamily endonuclease
MSHRNVQGTVYLLHFSKPYKHAAHYMGWAKDLESRLTEHQAGQGARLIAVIKAAGIDWKLARTWKGDRYRERQLKNQGSSKRHCPDCGVKPRKEPTMNTTLTGKATPAEAAELQYALERGSQRADQAARQAGPWGSDYQARFQTAADCNEVAADVARETLARGLRRPGESTAGFLSRTRAEAQAAEAEHAGAQAAGQNIRAQACAGTRPGNTNQLQEAETETAASLPTDAKTAGRLASAREHAGAAGAYPRDPKELDAPGLTPGAPHPVPALAAKGWHVCDHGIYTRHPDGQLEAEPEAC